MGFREPDARELAARDCLRRLVDTYSRACDRRDFVLLRSLYHDDALEEHGDMFTGSPDEYVAWVETALSNWQVTAHYVTNALFAVDGAEEIVTGSRSLDRFARRDGEWRFLGRCVTLDWATCRPASAEAYENFAAASPHGAAGPSDLSYGRLALFPRGGISA